MDWHSDGAWAILDSQGGRLSDGVGVSAVGDLSSFRAVGGVSGDDRGGVGHVAVVGLIIGAGIDGGNCGCESEEGGQGLHFCDLFALLRLWTRRMKKMVDG